MVSKEDAKKEVKKLIDKYGKYRASGDIKNFAGKEETTKTTFILPLFKALGWDVYNEKSLDLVCEEGVLRGAVDYAFRTDGQNKFFVEAKPIGSELKKYATQAIEYGVNSGNTWVVLTNFESIIIFNCEWQEKNWWKNALFTPLNYKNYLNKFDLLWLLSKESIINNKLDEYASTVGKKVPRTPIDKELLSKFLQWRLKLSKDISKTYKSTEEVDEFVQKLLIRLLFIKNCEDRDFETNYKLLPVIKAYESHKKGLLKILRHIFDYYNKIYDSSIFEPGEIDKISFDESLLAKIIYGLHFTSDGLRYNFKIIPADVMGNLYEQYLGHILKKTPQRAKLKEGKAHRKEQGVYYTPSYIVDYIVKNTLGELLKDKKVDASKIRVLDPACGSGSFLIKAFQILDDYYKKKEDYTQTKLDVAQSSVYSKKVEILKNNIFGVDLDQKAVEIARLNLLLQIVEKGEKLPLLEKNIQLGNSLIDDPEVVGEDKAFKWRERFKQIMDEGGFDVVIGNPPYDVLLPSERVKKFQVELNYLRNNSLYIPALGGRTNLFRYFVVRSMTLLKEGGYLGLIVPLAIINDKSTYNLRNWLLEEFTPIRICNFPQKDDPKNRVFKDAKLSTCIIIFKKEKTKQKFVVQTYPGKDFIDNPKEYNATVTDIQTFDEDNYTLPLVSKEEWSLLKKLHNPKKYQTIKDYAKSYQGEMNLTVQKKNFTINPLDLVMLKGVEVGRYKINVKLSQGTKEWFSRNRFEKIKQNFRRLSHINMSRITLQQITGVDDSRRIRATIIDKGTILANTTNYVIPNRGEDIYFLCGVLNSHLIDWRFRKSSTNNHVNTYEIDSLPIPLKINNEAYNKVSLLVKSILSKSASLNRLFDKKTDKRARIEEEIKKTDAEIDELVYKIYGITEKEKKIIEESLK